MVPVLLEKQEFLRPARGVLVGDGATYMWCPPRICSGPRPFLPVYAAPVVNTGEIWHLIPADDVQLYLPLNFKSGGSLQPLLECLYDIKAWMRLNFLHLNENKTEVIVFGHPDLLDASSLGPLTRTFTPL